MNTAYVLRVLLFSGLGYGLGAFTGYLMCKRKGQQQ